MKKLSLFLLLVTWLCILNVKANACADTLYLVGKKCYVKDKHLTHVELSNLFKSFPDSKVAYDKYINMHAGDILISSLTGFSFGYGITPFLFPGVSNYNQTAHLVMVVIGLGGLAWSINLEEKKQEALNTAIVFYNKALLLKCATP
jgi:hypothetical protein